MGFLIMGAVGYFVKLSEFSSFILSIWDHAEVKVFGYPHTQSLHVWLFNNSRG